MNTAPSVPALPPDYDARVYAGVLGKLIGVYLGRPFEQWSHESIAQRWGVIDRYVHDDLGLPLIVTDDDITGTFTFIRALLDHDSGARITSREIGLSWMNYIAENRHILWWGGMGQSTEHTAFLRLKAGIEAPRSGSIELNGKAVAEEIGSQIFIDGWALVSPNQPEQAARLAREAARVSHDGEAIHGAVLVAVMESLAFAESDIDRLIDGALRFVPADSQVAHLTADLRRWHREDGDWRASLKKLREQWGYEKYGTGCPLISNLGVILLALLHGAGDFDRSLLIVNTAGYDTDCNAGNLGCLLGIRGGLDVLRSGYDWRTPVNDRMFLPAADGHWGLMDAARMARILADLGRRLAGQPVARAPHAPRYPFDLPGATHGFAPSELCPLATRIEPVEGGIRLAVLAPGLRCDVEIPVFILPDQPKAGTYALSAAPSLYPGQVLRAHVRAGAAQTAAVRVRLFVRAYRTDNTLELIEGPEQELAPGAQTELVWIAPSGAAGLPLVTAGVALAGAENAALVLESFTWEGLPALEWKRPAGVNDHGGPPSIWARAFVQQIDDFHGDVGTPFKLIQNRGRGLLHTGCEDWRDYRIAIDLTPMLAAECGIAVRVRGLTCFYALLLRAGNRAVLVRSRHEESLLGEIDFAWEARRPVRMELAADGRRIRAWLDGVLRFDVEDTKPGLESGGVGLLLNEGRITAGPLRLTPGKL